MAQSDTAHDYWLRFRSSFQKKLDGTSVERFGDAWHSEPERTLFYVRDVLPQVATDLKLRHVPELFTVDMAIGAASPTGTVPLIWVESENNADTATHEIRKLAALSGAVKVLITCCEWDDSPGAWKHGGKRTHYLNQWLSIVRSHAKVWPSVSVFAVIVGEWNETRLRFYATVLDPNGEAIEDNEILFDKVVGPAPLSVDDRFILDVTDHGPMTITEMARRCHGSEARIKSILSWAQTSRLGQRRYNIQVDGENVTVASKGDWRREILERFRGAATSTSAEQTA